MSGRSGGAHVEHEVAFVVFQLSIKSVRSGHPLVCARCAVAHFALKCRTHTRAADEHRFGSAARSPSGIEAIGGGMRNSSYSPRMVSASCKRESHVIKIAMLACQRKWESHETSNPFIVQTSTTSFLNSTAVLTHSSRCGSISLKLASPRQKLVMKCLPVERADISGNCIWGANLAALTNLATQPFDTSCVCWEHLIPHSSYKRNGHMPSATAHDVVGKS